MTILWINLSLVLCLSFFARYFSVTRITSTESVLVKPNKFLVFCVIVCLVLISGLRTNIGDTYFYKHSYEINDFTWEFIQSQKDFGFGILQSLLKKFSNDPQILIFTTALITNVLIVIVLYRYTRVFDLSLYVYITSGLFLVSMNGIRQFLAAAIIFTGTKFLFKGRWKLFILIVLLASTFHQSALILIPTYFLVRLKAWSKSTIILLVCGILILISFDQFSSILFSAIKDSQYGQYVDFAEGGANWMRVAVTGAPIIIAYLGREKLQQLLPESDYIVNMALLDLFFMVISTQNWIFARFSIYFSLYQLILISWVVKLFSKRDQKLIYYGIILCYFFYYYYENVISLNIVYKSNFLSLPFKEGKLW
jgi:transmembrane protein EpsG